MCKQYFPREIVAELLDIKPITTLDDRQPVQMVTRESLQDTFPDQWDGYSDERSTIDQERGETVFYREHLKTRKRIEIRRETHFD